MHSVIEKICLPGARTRSHFLLENGFEAINTQQSWLFIGATRNFEEIEAFVIEHLDDAQAVIKGKPALLEIGRIEFDRHGKVGTDFAAHGPDALEQQAGPIFEAATPLVVAPVNARRQEFTEQVAVRCMDLHTRKAGFAGDSRSVRKACHDVTNFIARQGARPAESPAGQREGDAGWPDRLGGDGLRGLAPGVTELHPKLRLFNRAGLGHRF